MAKEVVATKETNINTIMLRIQFFNGVIFHEYDFFNNIRMFNNVIGASMSK